MDPADKQIWERALQSLTLAEDLATALARLPLNVYTDAARLQRMLERLEEMVEAGEDHLFQDRQRYPYPFLPASSAYGVPAGRLLFRRAASPAAPLTYAPTAAPLDLARPNWHVYSWNRWFTVGRPLAINLWQIQLLTGGVVTT